MRVQKTLLTTQQAAKLMLLPSLSFSSPLSQLLQMRKRIVLIFFRSQDNIQDRRKTRRKKN